MTTRLTGMLVDQEFGILIYVPVETSGELGRDIARPVQALTSPSRSSWWLAFMWRS